MVEDAGRRAYLGLFFILAIGLFLRLWGISFGLPHPYCRPDETTLVHKALSIGAGDLNPHFFNYPSLHFYLLTGVYGLYFGIGHLCGLFADLEDFRYYFFTDPAAFFILGRICSALLATASIFWIYLIGRYLVSVSVGLFSAFFLSIAFLHVRESHFLTVDAPATFHMLLACVFALRYLREVRLHDLILSALILGLAASTKYNLALFGVSILTAVVLACSKGTGGSGFIWKNCVLAAAFMGGGFLLGSPFTLVDFPAFWRDLMFERHHFATGHGLDLGRGWSYHLTFTLPHGLGWPLLIVGLAGIFFLAKRREGWVLLSGALIYYLIAGSGKTVFVRYMLPLIPLLCASAALAVDELRRRWLGYWSIVLAGALAMPSAQTSYLHSRLLAREDTRLQAGKWIEQHLSSGTRIALQGSDYGYPLLRRSRQWLAERLEDERRRGLGGRRLTRQLQWPDYPAKPNYYVVEVVQEKPQQELMSVWEVEDIAQLREKGIYWIVTQEHPLIPSSRNAGLRRQLDREGQLVQSFEPFTQEAAPVYDPIDAYYVPLSGFSGVERPGPTLRIYRFDISD